MAEAGVPSVRVAALDSRACLRLQAWAPEIERGVASVATTGVRLLLIAPGDWLMRSHERSGPELQRHVESCLPGNAYALVDLSDGYAAFEVQGPAARELLSKGCGLDFHSHSFTPGKSARTRFAGIPVVIICLADSSHFELIVARSFCDYLHDWILDAAVELQVTS